MKKIISFVCVIILVLSTTGCANTRTTKITLKNPDYSYQSAGEEINAEYTRYDEEYLTNLKQAYQLDNLVKDCKSDFDKVKAVTTWVTNLWEHDGMTQPEKNDPLFILDEVTKNGKQFRCVEYGTVISGCLLALDIPARTIGLKMKDVETIRSGAGHVGTEVYLKDLNKWAFVDGQWGAIPTMDGVPLNCVEFSQALKDTAEKQKLDIVSVSKAANQQGSTDAYKRNYFNWIAPYLYYFDVSYKKNGENISVMLTPTGAKQPTIFQVSFPLKMDVYTDSVVDFYHIPKL